jgi:hypothetical protein
MAGRRTLRVMTPLAALRAARTIDGIPSASDEELLAWSGSLLTEATPARPRPRRTEPLRAVRHNRLSTAEVFAEIQARATALARQRR